MTNAEKFKEVFGFKPQHCVAPDAVCKDVSANCKKCPFDEWWDKDYKECFKIRSEFE